MRAASLACRLALTLSVLTSTAARADEAPRPTDEDGVHTVLCLSGGGTRAAAFAHGAILGLSDAGLLDRVDRVVGVSGGSLAAAQLALDRHPEALDRFERLVLRQDLERAMMRSAAGSPFQLVARDRTRGDVAAECFAERLQGESPEPATFATLAPRPELWIQTTDVRSGRPVVLSRDRLVDPATFPLARAVAASTAFPGIFPPVRVDGVADVGSALFLGDGGIVDNLGLEPALDAIPPGATRVVLVVVNARCGLAAIDDDGLGSSVRTGLRTLELQQRRIDELVLARASDRLRLLALEARLAGRPLEASLVVVDFGGSARREALDAIGTRFALSDEEVTLLIEEGRAVAGERAREVAEVFRR